jgi:hypothetical protein
LLDGSTKPIERIAADRHIDENGRRFLEIEVGTPEFGPTYRLYALIDEGEQWHAAGDDAPLEQLVLVPNTIIGLYDDYEDDLGVWWASPLLPFRKHLFPRTHAWPRTGDDAWPVARIDGNPRGQPSTILLYSLAV